jgi:hypothetical protein
VTSANIVGQCREVNSDPDKHKGLENYPISPSPRPPG